MSDLSKTEDSVTTPQAAVPDELRSRLKLVRQKLKQTRANRPTPDTIHQLRVSTRRATAAIQSMSKFLPDQPADNCLSVLRKVRHLAGDVRDLDILLSRFDFESDEPTHPVSSNQLAELRKFVKRRRRKLTRRLREHRLQPQQKKQQKVLSHKVRWRGDGEEPSPEDHARLTVAHYARRSMEQLEPWPTDPASLHELRLSLKRLRYSIGFFRELIGATEFDRIHRRLKRLQTELGAISDGRAMSRILKRILRHCPKKHVDVVTTLQRIEHEKLATTCEAFLARWTDDRREELRAMLSSLAEADASNVMSAKNEAS